MRLCFLGDSHAAYHLARAAERKGATLVGQDSADIIFVSQDTPTDEQGRRDVEVIRKLVYSVRRLHVPIVITSQVTPGFTRSFGSSYIWHQAETLRISDAEDRALNPEMMIVGCADPSASLPPVYKRYLDLFECPILLMGWEEAEFAKIAINAFLAAQVDATNRLAEAATRIGADWGAIQEVLRHDRRIGQYAYLTPGRWQDSRHLLRDMRTLSEILGK
jgi:UDPglucose 6-dehydrogenase